MSDSNFRYNQKESLKNIQYRSLVNYPYLEPKVKKKEEEAKDALYKQQLRKNMLKMKNYKNKSNKNKNSN